MPLAEFHLVDDGKRVEIRWLDPCAEHWLQLDSIVIGGREFTPDDGQAFYDGLDRAYPGSIETVGD